MPAGARRVDRLVIAAVAVMVLLPVWASPVLVTTDGPSHVYNAVVTEAVRSERAPYAAVMEIDGRWGRPNQATPALLVPLGRVVGWEAAERVVFTLAVAGTFAALLALIARPTRAALAPAAGWLAQSWFVWMGFYDFALSLALYAGLLFLLEREPTPRRRILVQAIFAGLSFTHVLTLAVAAGLTLAVTGWRAVSGRGRWRELAVAGPALGLLLVEVGGGGTGTGKLLPADPWLGIVGLAIGDFVMSVHGVDAVAGALIMAAVWFALARRVRAAQREGPASLSGAEIFGLLLLLLSVVGPERVGEGGFVAIRLRCLGAITLLPSLAAVLGTVRVRVLAVAAGVWLLTLAAHGALHVRGAVVVNRDFRLLESLFAAGRVPAGAWLRTRFTTPRRAHYAIADYHHIADRLAVRRSYVVLDNYEALYHVFPVSWRTRPDWVTFRPSIEGLTVRLVPGDRRWPNVLYVLHESGRRLQSADHRIEIGPTLAEGRFALTPVRRRL